MPAPVPMARVRISSIGTCGWATQYKLAPKRPWDADRYFRFRKYWDYSLGIASDLFYHVIAPLNICWDEPQFPTKVMATGGIYVFKTLPDGKPDREVPDTFHLLAEYAKGHSLVLSSSMANDTHIPGMIRGHEGTIIMVEHGQFERNVPYITVKPQVKNMRGRQRSRSAARPMRRSSVSRTSRFRSTSAT